MQIDVHLRLGDKLLFEVTVEKSTVTVLTNREIKLYFVFMIREYITLDKKKFIIGCVFAAILIGICCLFYSVKAGLVLGAMTVIVGGFRLNNKSNIITYIWSVIVLFIICCCSQCLITYSFCFWNIGAIKLLLELLCSVAISGILFVIFLNARVACMFTSIFLSLLSVADYYVFRFKGNELMPTDILSVKTAANVASQQDYSLPAFQFYMLALIFISVWSLFCFSNIRIERKARTRMISASVEIIILIICVLSFSNIDACTWGTEGTNINGYFVNFSCELVDALESKKPDGYSHEEIAELEKEYSNDNVNTSSDSERTNVIVIMDETFSDLDVYGETLKSEAIPFYKSLNENCVKGYALVSTFGGGTANSEFEMLTGNSMAFLPSGATAYQLYINDFTYSITSEFNKLGYASLATHPYLSSGWSRTKVYPLLGFDDMTFIDDYPQKNLVRKYVSDWEMFEYVIDKYEKMKEQGSFIFGVSMQNHSGYDYNEDGYTPEYNIEGLSQEYPQAEQYLGLLNESDKALEYLISYFESVDEKTVILFFGDHQASLGEAFYNEINGGAIDSLEEEQTQYTVPFVIWANYDIDEKFVDITSLNYLSTYLYEAAGMELPPYQKFLKDLEEIIPAINSKGYYSSKDKKYKTFEDAEGIEKEWISKYQMLQYNCLFDDEKSDIFFDTSSIE